MTDFRLEELANEHETLFLKTGLHGFGHSRIFPHALESPSQFRKFVKECDKQRLDWRPGPNKTSLTRYLMLDPSGGICAFGLMRFPLDEESEKEGGNLYCEVPPDLRGRGYGSMCLALLLFEAVRAGLRRVLVTCQAADLAARRVIEKNRGEIAETGLAPLQQDSRVCRYWIRF